MFSYTKCNVKRLLLVILLVCYFTGCDCNLQCYQCTTDETKCKEDFYCGMYCEDHVLRKSYSLVRPLYCPENSRYCIREIVENDTNRIVTRYCAKEPKGNVCEGNICVRSCMDDGCNGLLHNSVLSVGMHLSWNVLILLVAFHLL